MTMGDDKTVFGAFEHVSVPSLGINDVVAKVDTGAYSGAIHCSLIETYRRESDGKKVLRFIPSNNHAKMTETRDYTVTHVRSSTGHRVKRYLIKTEIVVNGKTYPITVGLSNRSDMQKQILIGRRFLRENDIIVDTRINQILDSDGGEVYEDSNIV